MPAFIETTARYKQREQLWRLFNKLSYDLQNLASVIQNPADGIPDKCFKQWEEQAEQFKNDVNTTTQLTTTFLQEGK